MTLKGNNVTVHFFDSKESREGTFILEKEIILHKSDEEDVEINIEDLRSQRKIEYEKDISDKNENENIKKGTGIVVETIGGSDYIFTSEDTDMIELKNEISDNYNKIDD